MAAAYTGPELTKEQYQKATSGIKPGMKIVRYPGYGGGYIPLDYKVPKPKAKPGPEKGTIDDQGIYYNGEYKAPTGGKDGGKTVTVPTDYGVGGVPEAETEDPLQLEKDKLAEEEEKFKEMQSEITALSEQFSTQLGKASESFQKSFLQLSESLGGQVDLFANQMQIIQKQSGMMVDVEQAGFQEEIGKIIEQGGSDFIPVMQKYLKTQEFDTPEVAKLMQDAKMAGVPSQAVADVLKNAKSSVFPVDVPATLQGLIAQQKTGAGEKPEATAAPVETYPLPDKNPGAGYSTDIVPESSPSDQMAAGLENIGGMSGDSVWSMMESVGYDLSQMSSAEALQVMLLQQQLVAANDPATNDFLTRMMEHAENSYNSTVAQSAITVKEIDAIISGEDIVPTSFESLAAKAYKQQAELSTESIELEKSWLTAQYDAWMTQEQDKRGRLEGYLKAKMVAMGGAGSSSALALMAMQVNAADMRLQLKASEYQYSMGKLNLESRGIMENFTNNVVGLAMEAESKSAAATNAYTEKMFEIEGMFIENEKEKSKLKMNALSSFSDQMYKIEQDQKTWAWKEYEQSYKEIQDSIDNANKLSGMTGSIYYVDENGDTVDSGIPTLDAQKWEESNVLNWAKHDRNVTNDSWDKAMDLIDGGMDDAAALVLGLEAGAFSGYQTDAEKKAVIAEQKANATAAMDIIEQLAGENGAIALAYKEGAYGGQCGAFIHNLVTNYPHGLNTLDQKMSVINSGIPAVGSVVILNEQYPGTNTGHVAIINKIGEDGSLTLTESNYHGDEKVTNTRVISVEYSKIMGYFDGTLDPTFQGFVDGVSGEAENKPYIFNKNDFVGTAVGQLPEYVLNALNGLSFNLGSPEEEGVAEEEEEEEEKETVSIWDT